MWFWFGRSWSWTEPRIGGRDAPLKRSVYGELLAWWRRNGVGRERRPNPNVRLAHVPVVRLSEGLREEVEQTAEHLREQGRAQRRARSGGNRGAEARQERARRRGRRAPQTALGEPEAVVDRVRAFVARFADVSEDMKELLLDLAATWGGEVEQRLATFAHDARQSAVWLAGFATQLRAWADTLPDATVPDTE